MVVVVVFGGNLSQKVERKFVMEQVKRMELLVKLPVALLCYLGPVGLL